MPSISSDARFLGVDLALLWRDMREPWRNVHQWPVLSWLTPQPPVLLLQADGKQSVWEGGRQVTSRAIPRFKAVELPDDLVLRVVVFSGLKGIAPHRVRHIKRAITTCL